MKPTMKVINKPILSLFLVACLMGITYSNDALTQNVSEVKPIVRVVPIYPTEMLKKKQEGWVRVKFDINKKGWVEDPIVVDSHPRKVFDREAIRAILKFKFKPKMIDGKPVKATATQLIEFNLSNNQTYDNGQSLTDFKTDDLSYTLTWVKHKWMYQNTLEIRDKKNNDLLIKKIKLPESKFISGYFAHSKGSPYLFYYQNLSNKKGRIYIYNKSDFSDPQILNTKALLFTHYNLKTHVFFSTIPHSNKLLAYLGSTRKPALYEIDGKTGQIDKKMTFKPDTLLKSSTDMAYIWSRRISNEGQVTSARFNRVMKNKIQFHSTENYHLIRDIKLTEKLISLTQWNNVVMMTFDCENDQPRYRTMLLNLTTNEYYKDFYSARKPLIYTTSSKPEKLILIGLSSGNNQYLKIVTQGMDDFKDHSNKDLYIKYNNVDFLYVPDETYSMMVYGEKSFASIDILNPESFTHINLPFDVAHGFYNSDYTKGYLAAQNGSEVALVNIKSGEFIASKKTGSLEKKIGNALAKTIFFPLTIPHHLFSTPLGSFENSDNILFLNNKNSRLFALNKKTQDVTSFNAEDLSDKLIVNTGSGTLLLLQAKDSKKAPIIAIGNHRVTFMDPDTGELIKHVRYDEPLKIEMDYLLTYRKGADIEHISLADPPE